MVPVNKFAFFAIFHGIGGPKMGKVTFFIPTGWYMSICPLNIKNNFGPLGVPIFVPAGVSSGARQHICTVAIFHGICGPKWENVTVSPPPGWYNSICALNTKNSFGPLGAPILAPAGVLSGARQHSWTFCGIS